MNDRLFPKKFLAAERSGAYFRVIEEGDVGADDRIEIVSRPSHGVTLRTMARALRDPRAAAALQGVRGLPVFWKEVADG